ncbi:MAG: hypothetical protein FWD17_10230 [Polyangiaceae bacterium]|nr:hypothetical protein [Polyangiaceae bacterium]
MHRERRAKLWPLVAGTLGLGAMYLSSVGVGGLAGERAPAPWLNVPVVGPCVFVVIWKGAREPQGIDNVMGPVMLTFFSDALLVVDSAVQTAGLALLAYGAFARESVVVADPPAADASVRLSPVPVLLGRGAPGLAVIGTF